MAKRKTSKPQAPTVWELPDAVWPMVQAILDEHYPSKPKGHRRVNLRRVLNGIIFRLRTGCQWNRLPAAFGDDSTVHRHFQRWCQQGLFERLWAALVGACDELHGVDWQWQAADTAMGKARMGATRWAATRPTAGKRGKAQPRGRGDRRPTGGDHRWGECA